MYNRGRFNNLRFNAPSKVRMGYRLVSGRGRSFGSRLMMRVSARLNVKKSSSTARAGAIIGVYTPIIAKSAVLKSRASARITVRMWPRCKTAAAKTSAVRLIVWLYAEDLINFAGLVIPPGGTLIIDTARVTAEMNGVNVMEFWQTGGVPFNLFNGNNLIGYFDGEDERRVEMTVVFRERWL